MYLGNGIAYTFAVSLSTFARNSASGNGGAVFVAGKVDIRTSKFYNNGASLGGALYLKQGVITLADPTTSNLEFYNNVASVSGGAVWAKRDVLTFNDAIFFNNTAQASGGAIYAEADQSLPRASYVNAANSLFTLNKASYGGAIEIVQPAGFGWDTSFANTTFSSNSGSTAGGAISARTPAGAPNLNYIRSGSFLNNTAPSGGAVYFSNRPDSKLLIKVEATLPESSEAAYPVYIQSGILYCAQGVVPIARADSSSSQIQIDTNDAEITRISLTNAAYLYLIGGSRFASVVDGGSILTSNGTKFLSSGEGGLYFGTNSTLRAFGTLHVDAVSFESAGGVLQFGADAALVGSGDDAATDCLVGPEGSSEPTSAISHRWGTISFGRQCKIYADLFTGDTDYPDEIAHVVLPAWGTVRLMYDFVPTASTRIHAYLYNETRASSLVVDHGTIELAGQIIVRNGGSYLPASSSNYTIFTVEDAGESSFSGVSYNGTLIPFSQLSVSSEQTTTTTTLIFSYTPPPPVAPPVAPPAAPPVASPVAAPVTAPVSVGVSPVAGNTPVADPSPSSSAPLDSIATPASGSPSPVASPFQAAVGPTSDSTQGGGGSGNGGAIAGGVIGALLGLALIIGGAIFFVRYRKQQQQSGSVWDNHNDAEANL